MVMSIAEMGKTFLPRQLSFRTGQQQDRSLFFFQGRFSLHGISLKSEPIQVHTNQVDAYSYSRRSGIYTVELVQYRKGLAHVRFSSQIRPHHLTNYA
jgi:hypothetical protein